MALIHTQIQQRLDLRRPDRNQIAATLSAHPLPWTVLIVRESLKFLSSPGKVGYSRG
jgi:hypothetical protein